MQIRKILILVLLILSNSVFGLSKRPLLVAFHINGVNTTLDEATDNLDKLRQITKIDSNIVKWELLHNKAHTSLMGDLWDVFRQKRQEGKELTIDDYTQTYIKAKKLIITPNSPEYENLKYQIKEKYISDLGFVGANFESILTDFHNIERKLNLTMGSFLAANDKYDMTFLFIPHSQGNLYVNTLTNYLTSTEHYAPERLAVFGIAVPAKKIASTVNLKYTYVASFVESKQHITASNDFVINSLRLFSFFIPVSKQPLKGNVHLSNCLDFKLCHNLRDAYLMDNMAREMIALRIRGFIVSSIYNNFVVHQRDPSVFTYVDLHNEVTLLDKKNKKLCYNGVCDKNLFSYVDVPVNLNDSSHENHLLKTYRDYLTFNFPGVLPKGTYKLLGNFEKIPTGVDIIGDGLTNVYAMSYEGCGPQDRICAFKKIPTIRYDDNVINRIEKVYAITQPNYGDWKFMSLVCGRLPGLCYQNKFLFGYFTLQY